MNFKNKMKNIVSLGTANFSAAIIIGLFWFFLARIIEKTEYGEIGFLMSIANVGFAISMIGLGATVVVYGPKKENVFPAAFILVLISSSIAGLITYILVQNIVTSLLIIGMVVFFIISTGLQSKFRYSNFSKHLVIRAAISVLLALFFYQLYGINGILLGYFLANFLILKELHSLLKHNKIQFSVIRNKVKFMIKMWSNALSGILFWWGDKLIIGSLFGFSMLGNYHLSVQYLLLLETIPRSLAQYLVPQESSGQNNKKIKIFSIILACLISIVSIIIIPFAIGLFLPEYLESVIPIQIMSIAIIPLSISTIQQSEFMGKEHSSQVLFGSLVQTGTYFSLIVILGEIYGLEGFAIGFLSSAIIRVIINLFLKRFLFKKNKPNPTS